MTEKKTFKNQRVAWQYEPLMRKYGWCVEDEPCFFADEWDMEVTFTRKRVEITAGAVVTDGYYDMRVVAIEGDRAWCYNFVKSGGRADNFYSTEWLRDLKHADS